jgi:hypothetical protein
MASAQTVTEAPASAVRARSTRAGSIPDTCTGTTDDDRLFVDSVAGPAAQMSEGNMVQEWPLYTAKRVLVGEPEYPTTYAWLALWALTAFTVSCLPSVWVLHTFPVE